MKCPQTSKSKISSWLINHKLRYPSLDLAAAILDLFWFCILYSSLFFKFSLEVSQSAALACHKWPISCYYPTGSTLAHSPVTNSISKGETRSKMVKLDLKIQKLDLKTERTRFENPRTRFFGLLAQCPPVELRTKKACESCSLHHYLASPCKLEFENLPWIFLVRSRLSTSDKVGQL